MAYKQADIGKCETCGFFSKHGRGISAPTPRFYEVERVDRRNPNEIFTYYVGGQMVDVEIACLLHKVNFMLEIHPLSEGERGRKAVEIIRADRHCDAWCEYVPGFNPMEHYEDMRMRQFEISLEADREARERSYQRQNIFLVITGLILSAGQIIAAIILSYRESFTDQILRHLFGR